MYIFFINITLYTFANYSNRENALLHLWRVAKPCFVVKTNHNPANIYLFVCYHIKHNYTSLIEVNRKATFLL